MILFIKFPPVIAVGAGAFIVQKDVRITLAQLFADVVKPLHIHCQNRSQRQLALFDFQTSGASGGKEFARIFGFTVKFPAAGQIFLHRHVVRYAVFAFHYAQNI